MSRTKEEELVAFCKDGNVDDVERLIQEGVDVDWEDVKGWTPLHHATFGSKTSIVSSLLSHRADPNMVNKEEKTPLHYAAEKGDMFIVKSLLSNVADPNVADEEGWTPLHYAANYDHRDIASYLFDYGANPNVPCNMCKTTPLHCASEHGHESIVLCLLDKKADPNVPDKSFKKTPLHYAAEKGYESIALSLLSKGVDPNATDLRGRTPLHYAAENGHEPIVSAIVNHGGKHNVTHDVSRQTTFPCPDEPGKESVPLSILSKVADLNITDKDGKTPLRLATEKGHKSVVLALIGAKPNVSDVNGKATLCRTTEKDHKSEELALPGPKPNVSDINDTQDTNEPKEQESYPSAIKRMDENSRKLYKKVLECGYETKREILVIVVGKKGAGKTCLTRRLRSKPIDDVNDTNGIEIHSLISKSDSKEDDTTWHEMTQTADSRLLTCTMLAEKDTQMDPTIDSDNGCEVIYERLQQSEILKQAGTEHMEKKTTYAEINKEESMNLEKQSTKRKHNPINHDKDMDIDQVIKDMANAKENEKDDIRIHVWDFGGDEEFYYTHQLFLAEDVVFLIVTSLADSIVSDKDFQFWLDTIHCLCKDPKSIDLKPRCIVVGTKTDLCQNVKAADKVLGKKLQSVPGTLRNHIYREGFLISNKESFNEPIKDIKTAIINAAKESTQWKSEHPMKFILLDKALDKKRCELEKRPVLTHSEVKRINERLHQPLTVDELDLYLRYNHLAGHLIYYEDLPDYIVIVPQWLSELFRCVVTADKFRSSQLPKHDLEKLRSTGLLTKTLLEDIFKIKQFQVDVELQSYLMKIMEKFHIVIQLPNLSEDEEKQYFAPCMVRDKKFDTNYFKDSQDKSTWLCLECNFLPPFIFNHIVIFFCEKYICAEGPDGLPSFYSDGAVFDITSSGCEKLVVLRLSNVIQLQVIRFGQPKRQVYSEIKSLLSQKMAEFTQTFSMRIKYEYKWKCPKSSSNYRRHMEFNACREGGEYYCTEHRQVHIFQNYWDEDIQMNQDTESITTLSNDELNFTRLAMLVTEVLTDALHDLLPLPKAMTRNQCDVSSLYQAHRALNNHVPSSGRWGGVQTVNDIPPTAIQVGDDIERCRVIRNRLNHPSHYIISDNEINNVHQIIQELLTRLYTFMGLSFTPTYMDRAKEIKRKTYAVSDRDAVKEKLDRESNIHNYSAEKIEIHHHHYK